MSPRAPGQRHASRPSRHRPAAPRQRSDHLHLVGHDGALEVDPAIPSTCRRACFSRSPPSQVPVPTGSIPRGPCDNARMRSRPREGVRFSGAAPSSMQGRGGRLDDVEATYRRYFALIREKCRRMLGDFAEADDVAQETFVRLWRTNLRAGDRRSVLAWIYKTRTPPAIDRLRGRPEKAA